jgi:hypothetical protein
MILGDEPLISKLVLSQYSLGEAYLKVDLSG